jgi:hypothetical protein
MEVDGASKSEPKKVLRDGQPYSAISYDKAMRRIRVNADGDLGYMSSKRSCGTRNGLGGRRTRRLRITEVDEIAEQRPS